MPNIPIGPARASVVEAAAEVISQQEREENDERLRKMQAVDITRKREFVPDEVPVLPGWPKKDGSVARTLPVQDLPDDPDADARPLGRPPADLSAEEIAGDVPDPSWVTGVGGTGGPEDEVSNLSAKFKARREAQLQAETRSRLLDPASTPDQAAADLDLATKSGVNRIEVEQDRETYKAVDQAKEIDQVYRKAPLLRDWLADRANFDIAHDDLANLEWWERTGKIIGAGAESALPTLWGGVTATGQMITDQIDQFFRSPDPLIFRDKFSAEEVEYLKTHSNLPSKPVKEGDFLPTAGKALGGMARAAFKKAESLTPTGMNDFEAGAYSGVQSLLANAPAIVVSAITKSPLPAVATGTTITTGQAYNQAREKGLSVDEAARFAVTQGAIEYVTEKIPMSQLFGDLATKTGFLTTLRNQLVTEGVGEQAATLLQDANEWATLHPDKPLSEFLAERPSAALQTAVATVIQTGAQTTMASGVDTLTRQVEQGMQQRRAEELERTFDAIAKGAKDSKLLKRIPDKYREAVAKVTKDGPLEEVRVTPEGITELAQSNNLTPEQIAQAFRIDPADMVSAIQSGNDVVIPAGNYAAALGAAQKEIGISGEAIHTALAPNMRLRASDFTAKEHEAMQKVFEEEQKAREDQTGKTQEFADSADRVRETIREAVAATKLFNAETANTQAAIAGEMVVTLAERTGQDPEKLWNELGFDVVAALNGEEDQNALPQQGAREVQPIDDETLTAASSALNEKEFEAWKGAREGLSNENIAVRMGGANADVTPAAVSVYLGRARAKGFDAAKATGGRPQAPETEAVLRMLARDVRPVDIVRALFPDRDPKKALNQVTGLKAKHPERIEAIRQKQAERSGALAQSSLPMDQASKDQRAKDQGFTIDAYHGTGEDITEFTVTPEVRNGLRNDKAVFFSETADLANSYATWRDRRNTPLWAEARRHGEDFIDSSGQSRLPDENPEIAGPYLHGANVMPVKLRLRKPLTFDAKGRMWASAWPDAMVAAKRGGHDGVIMKNVDDWGDGAMGREARSQWEKLRGKEHALRTVYAVFDPADIRSRFAAFDPTDDGSSNILAQGNMRGSYTPRADRSVIKLFESTNLSTFVHEASHWYLDTLWRMSQVENPHPFVLEQLAAIKEWKGKSPEWSVMFDAQGVVTPEGRDLHEAFAESFEAYLREGKAPSTSLRSVFASLKQWLMRIYKSISQIGSRVNLNDEIRAVFDRALASEEAIKAASASMARDSEAMAKALLDKGVITEKAFERTKERLVAAREKAEAELTARLMEDYERNQKAWWRDQERQVRREVQSEVDERPEQRAYAWLSGKGWRDTRADHANRAAEEAEAMDALTQDARRRLLDKMGFYSAAQEAALNVPDNIWNMGWQAARNAIVKGRGGIAPTRAEMEYLALDTMFGDSKLKCAALRDAVLEDIAASRLELVERYSRFDPAALVGNRKKADLLRDAVQADAAWDLLGLRLDVIRSFTSQKSGHVVEYSVNAQFEPRRRFWMESRDGTITLNTGTVVNPEKLGEWKGNNFADDPAMIAARNMAARLIAEENPWHAVRSIDEFDLEEDVERRSDHEFSGVRTGPGKTRLPGNEPVFEWRAVLPKGEPGSDFKSHWSRYPTEDDGVLVSVRGEERTDEKGGKTLFGGEVQSDMGSFLRNFRKKEGDKLVWIKEAEYADQNLANLDDVPLAGSTSTWTNVAVRAMVYRAARDGFDSVSFPTAETSTVIQGNDSAAQHYETNVKPALEKIAKQLGGQVRLGGVNATITDDELQDAPGYVNDPRFPELLRQLLAAKTLDDKLEIMLNQDIAEEIASMAMAGDLVDDASLKAQLQALETGKLTSPAYVLDITPAMRVKIMAEGFPLFQAGDGTQAGAYRYFEPDATDDSLQALRFRMMADNKVPSILLFRTMSGRVIAFDGESVSYSHDAARAALNLGDLKLEHGVYNPRKWPTLEAMEAAGAQAWYGASGSQADTVGPALAQAGDGAGRTSPPPSLSPMRLNLEAVRETYGEEALNALPPEVRAYAASVTDADQFVEIARDVRKTLNQKKPKTLTKFLSTRRVIGHGNDTIAYKGIRDEELAAAFIGEEAPKGLFAGPPAKNSKTRAYTMSDAVMAAWEEGYFNGPIPSPEVFIEALRRDADETAPLFRREDMATVQQIRDAERWEQWFEDSGVDISQPPAELKARLEEVLTGEAESAIGPDEAAPYFGMPDGNALLQGLKEGPKRNAIIRQMTEQRMTEMHGDPFKDGTIMQEAEQYARNEVQTRQDEIELEALARAAGQQFAGNLAKQQAQEALKTKQVREVLNYNQWLILEQRWMKKAVEAAEKGKFDEALEFKRYGLINRHMFREGRKLAEQIERSRKHLLSYGDKTKQARLFAAGAEYQQQMNGLLADYQLRPESRRAEDNRANRSAWIRAQMAAIDPYAAYQDNTKSPAEQIAEAQEALERSEVLARLAEGVDARNYKSLPTGEFLAVRDEADLIWRLATTKDRLIREGERRRLTLAAEDIAAEIYTNQPNDKPPEPRESDAPGEALKRGGLKYFAMHRTLQSLAHQFAGGKDGGVFWRYIVKPLNESFARLSTLRKKMGADMEELFGVYSKAERNRFFNDRKHFASIGESLTKQGRLAVALNWGNEKNRQRLMDSTGWTEAGVREILDTLDKRDWDFIQKTWDYLDTWFPEANRVHEAVHNAPMDKVAPLQVATKCGIYAGGYFPIAFDPNLSTKSGQRQLEAEAKAVTGRVGVRNKPGYSQRRIEGRVTLPLRLSVFDVIARHLDQVATSIATEEALYDAGRLIMRPEVQTAIIERHGRQIYNTIVNTLVTTKFGLEGASGVLAHLRNGATVVGLGWKVATALLQPLGVTNSIVRVGGYWIAKGYARMGTDALTIKSSADWIMERSEFMQHRRQSQSPELAALKESIGKKGLTPRWVTGSMFALMSNVQFYSVDMPTWYGAYYKAQAAGLDAGDSVAQADQAVIDSQGGGELHQTAAIQTGAGTKYAAALRLLTNFMSYMVTTYNLATQRARNANTPAKAAALGLDMILLLAVPVAGKLALDAWTKGGGDDDDDPLWEKYGREQIAFLLSPFVGVSQVAGAVRGDDAFGYRGPAGLGIFAEATNAGKAAAELDFDESFWRPANKTAGMIFHYPASQLDATVRGGMAMWKGETSDPKVLLFGPPPN